MIDEENGDPPQPDNLGRVPANPGDPKPPPSGYFTPMTRVEESYETADPQATPTEPGVQNGENNGFTTVITNGKKRRIKISIADKNTLIGLIPAAPPTCNSNVPVTPLALYENDQTSILQEEKGTTITYSKVKYMQRFKKSNQHDVFPGKDFQNIIGMMQKVDPALVIFLLAPTHNGSSNYINQTCYIPVMDDSQLQNYFTHTVLRDTVHGVFFIGTSKTIISVKENGYVQDFLSKTQYRYHKQIG